MWAVRHLPQGTVQPLQADEIQEQRQIGAPFPGHAARPNQPPGRVVSQV